MEDREVLAIVAAHYADMDALEQLDAELDDRNFDELAVMEERAEAAGLFEELLPRRLRRQRRRDHTGTT
jgi:hypothetical protein